MKNLIIAFLISFASLNVYGQKKPSVASLTIKVEALSKKVDSLISSLKRDTVIIIRSSDTSVSQTGKDYSQYIAALNAKIDAIQKPVDYSADIPMACYIC